MPVRVDRNVIPITTVGLSLALFALDLALPLGIADAILYGIMVFLSALSPQPRLPVFTAAGCTVLAIVGGVFSPTLPNVPWWIGWSNRLISLLGIWAPVVFIWQRRWAESLLREANDSLEQRVQERTVDLLSIQHMLQQSQQDLHALTGRLLAVQDAERRRMSRELHDDVNQRLALLALGIQTIEKHLTLLPDDARTQIINIHRDLVALSNDVRQMAYRFHPSILDDLGLDAALQRTLDDFTRHTKIKTLLVSQPLPSVLSKEIATALYRVVQECLSNVVRHAQASRVEVELTVEGQTMELTVRDNGRGFDAKTTASKGHGLGLLNVRERVLAIHGTCDLRSDPGMGTEVCVRTPLTVGNT
jgi:signal transduction histidine kinase